MRRRTVAALAIYASIHLCTNYVYIYISLIYIYIHLSIYLFVCLSTDPSVGCFYDGLNKLSDHSFVNNNFFAEFFCIAKGDTKKTGTPSNSCTGPIWFLRNLGIPYKVSSRICIYIYMYVWNGSFEWNTLLCFETQPFQLSATSLRSRLVMVNDGQRCLIMVSMDLPSTWVDQVDIQRYPAFYLLHTWKCSSSCKWIYIHNYRL